MTETPTSQRDKLKAAIAFLEAWLADESEQDGFTWPSLPDELDLRDADHSSP